MRVVDLSAMNTVFSTQSHFSDFFSFYLNLDTLTCFNSWLINQTITMAARCDLQQQQSIFLAAAAVDFSLTNLCDPLIQRNLAASRLLAYGALRYLIVYRFFNWYCKFVKLDICNCIFNFGAPFFLFPDIFFIYINLFKYFLYIFSILILFQFSV